MRLLHVTDVLPRPAYACDPWYLQRGKAVHLACHYLDTCGLDWSALDPRIKGYVEAWERCKAETGCAVNRSEVAVGGPLFGYVGTLDKIMDLPAGNKKMGWPVRPGVSHEVWDLKCGDPEPWHALQLAAYVHAYGGRMKLGRRTCHLSADATYRLIEHKGKDDLKVFLAMLTTKYWRLEHGLDEWPEPREGEERE